MKRLVALFAFALAAASCGDPVHDEEVAALGSDPSGEPNGPLHRAGQPCLACHGGQGPAHTQFSIAGTVYGTKGMTDAESGAVVHFQDANNEHVKVTSNQVGNFYILLSDYAPTYPINDVCIDGASASSQVMATHIMRQGSCAGCHFGTPGPTTPGPVYVVDPANPAMGTCQ